METSQFEERVHLLSVVAAEATEEPDVISRRPEIIDALIDLSTYEGLNNYFGGNGHDPSGFAKALAQGLEPYKVRPLDDNPEMIQGLAFLAWALQAERSEDELVAMQPFA
jgi:hypothetical protein